MSRSKIVEILGSLALMLGFGGYAAAQSGAVPVRAAAAVPYHSGNITCAKDGARTLAEFDQTCPAGFHYAQIPAADIAGLPTGTTAPVDSAVKIVHKTVTVNADYQAGTAAERTITFTGLPAYVSSGSAEVHGDNTGGVPDALAANISVSPSPSPTNGQTTRSFLVTASGFNGSESYVLDVWVLVTT